ncbi:MAG: hypothetical protein HY675_26930 [Chloroflexi bacterium]|nr:hypothetical protein [Chloroflexota bacterium]
MFLKQTRLAVSLEGLTLRLLTCQERSVTSWAEIPVEPRLLRNGFPFDARGLAQSLNASEKLAKLPKQNVVAALPGLQSFVRILKVPREVQGNLGTVVAGEARRSIPDVERNMFIYWQRFGPSNSLQQSVYLLAVPRQPLITYVEGLTAAGMRPRSIDLRPLAVARAVNRQDAIIGNSESMSLDVVIVRNDVPVMMRSLYLGQDFEPVEYVNARLAEELARTVSHFNSTSQEGFLAADTPVVLTGRGAADATLAAMVEDALQYPVAAPEPPFDYPKDFPIADYMVHLGLMLK